MTDDEKSKVRYMDEARLWKTLDNISDRLEKIESELSQVVRLEERVSYHHETLKRYGDRIDKHDDRIRTVENWQSENTGKTMASGKVIAWIAAAAASVITGVMTLVASLFIKGP